MARFMDVIRTRRALLGGGLAALTAAALSTAEQAAARKQTKRQRRRRRRRRSRGGGGPVGGVDCFVCESMSDGRNCRFTSIQAAIDAIPEGAAGGTLAICAGTFKERISLSVSQTDLTIQGAGTSQTIIDADGEGSAITIGRDADFITIEFLTITGGKAEFGGGVFNQARFTTISNCEVTGNDTGVAAGGGIYNDGGSLTLISTIVTENASLDGLGGGILNDGNGASLTLQGGSQVTKNQADQGGGIFNQGGTVTIASGSSVTDNEPDNCVGTTACSA